MLRDGGRALTMLVFTTIAFALLLAASFLLSVAEASGATNDKSGANVAPPAATADTLRLTIEQAVMQATGNNLAVRTSETGIEAANGRVREAMSYALPQIRGSLTYNRQFDSIFRESGASADSGLTAIFQNSPFGSVHEWNAELTASQLLWSGGRVGAGLAAAKSVRRSTQADLTQTTSDVALVAQRAYWNAVTARQVAAIAESSLAVARAQLRQVEQLHAQGARAEYDLLRAQVDAANQEPPVVSARNLWQIALLDFRRILNLPLEQPVDLLSPAGFDNGLAPVVEESVTDGASRASLVRASADVEARYQLMRLERAERWPQITLQGTMSQQAFPADGSPELDQFRRNVSGQVKMEFPLFLGGRTFGTVQRATAEWRQAQIELERARQDVSLEVSEARREVDRSLSVLLARRGTARLAIRTYRLAQSRYLNGLATQLEVSDSRVQAATAAVNEVVAARDYRISLAALEHAVGRPVRLVEQSLDSMSNSNLDEGR